MIALTHLSHYALRVADVERSIAFYLNVVGIDLTERRPDGTAYLRRGPDHHCLALYPLDHAQSHDPEMAGRPGLDHAAFAVPHREDVDGAARALKDAGARVITGPAELDEPGSPYAVRLADPDGNRIEVCTDMAEWIGPEIPHAAKSVKLGHVNFHVKDPRKTLGFYTNVLGFQVSDWIGDFFVFLRCNPDHHASALIEGPAPSMNHAAFEVETVEDMKNAADILWKNDVKTLWGLGRHGPGHNLFLYYPDPDGNVVEIFTELDRIHDDKNYRPLRWDPESATCVWTNQIPEAFVEATQAVGKSANAMT